MEKNQNQRNNSHSYITIAYINELLNEIVNVREISIKVCNVR